MYAVGRCVAVTPWLALMIIHCYLCFVIVRQEQIGVYLKKIVFQFQNQLKETSFSNYPRHNETSLIGLNVINK